MPGRKGERERKIERDGENIWPGTICLLPPLFSFLLLSVLLESWPGSVLSMSGTALTLPLPESVSLSPFLPAGVPTEALEALGAVCVCVCNVWERVCRRLTSSRGARNIKFERYWDRSSRASQTPGREGKGKLHYVWRTSLEPPHDFREIPRKKGKYIHKVGEAEQFQNTKYDLIQNVSTILEVHVFILLCAYWSMKIACLKS